MTSSFGYGSISAQNLNRTFPKVTIIPDADIVYMTLALEEARAAAAAGEVPIGAVLVVDGSIIGRGHNQRENWQDPTAHAEMIAIRGAAETLHSWRLLDSTLYVTMEPCVMCVGAAILARIKRLVFAVRDPKAGACGSIFNIPEERRLNHRLEVSVGILEQESRELLQEFFSSLRKKPIQAGL
ncbi:MAG TPA: tRNA adenosine(34) deaminase TadA [Nitrospirales bacterium]|jgi:tRNA(adenine34) deaminase